MGRTASQICITTYFTPPVKKYLHDNLSPDQKVLNGIGIHKDGKVFNPGFDELLSIAGKAGIPLVVYLHADWNELEEGKYDEQGVEIISWAEVHGVTLIKELDYRFTKEDYRDGIHINEKGQRKVAEIAETYFRKE